MTAVQTFLQTRDSLVDVADRCVAQIAEAQDALLLDLGPCLNKARQAMSALHEERLRVALVGDFSEGKTSLIAALTGRDDLEMGVGPTTTEVRFYDHEGWSYADTPGLRSEKDEHDLRTTRWISEAHLVLFLCSPENPLPAGQACLVRWLYNTLQKGAEILFVIARIDALGVDLEETTELDAALNIKREALRVGLQQHLGRVVEPEVVAIAARPYGQPFSELWRDREGWWRLSRLETLQQAVERRLATSADRLLNSAAAATLRDAVDQALAPVAALVGEGKQTLSSLRDQIGALSRELQRVSTMAHEVHDAILQALRRLRAHHLEAIEHAPDLAGLRLHVERDVGRDGALLQEEISSIVASAGQGLKIKVAPALVELNHEVAAEQTTLAWVGPRLLPPLLGRAAEALTASSVRALSASLLRLRDLIAPGIRFKPWGAIKLAKRLQGVGTAINVFVAASPLLEIWDEVKLRREREALKVDVLAIIDAAREDLEWASFLRECVPMLADLEASRDQMEAELAALAARVERATLIQQGLHTLVAELASPAPSVP